MPRWRQRTTLSRRSLRSWRCALTSLRALTARRPPLAAIRSHMPPTMTLYRRVMTRDQFLERTVKRSGKHAIDRLETADYAAMAMCFDLTPCCAANHSGVCFT